MTYMGSNIETSEFETRLGRASTVRLNREITTDSFTFHKKLGKGAFGVVYLVTDHKTNEKMALKVLEKQ
jgi:serine/threonine protein kinase